MKPTECQPSIAFTPAKNWMKKTLTNYAKM